ncbi:hypothetical protein LX87_04749 [Larkinella arboricola]|uniref:Uncharacterized protein n=1 Tax=Larkinella arboricola TaxID=643671 RepID=A0A327WQQ9_LARAB|nr:hypothetical protein LX87_04749 [Larkinella arboricola]
MASIGILLFSQFGGTTVRFALEWKVLGSLLEMEGWTPIDKNTAKLGSSCSTASGGLGQQSQLAHQWAVGPGRRAVGYALIIGVGVKHLSWSSLEVLDQLKCLICRLLSNHRGNEAAEG